MDLGVIGYHLIGYNYERLVPNMNDLDICLEVV